MPRRLAGAAVDTDDNLHRTNIMVTFQTNHGDIVIKPYDDKDAGYRTELPGLLP